MFEKIYLFIYFQNYSFFLSISLMANKFLESTQRDY